MTHQSLDLTCNMEMMFPSIKTLNCLVVWNMNFMIFHVYIYIHGILIPTDELIFFRGVQTTSYLSFYTYGTQFGSKKSCWFQPQDCCQNLPDSLISFPEAFRKMWCHASSPATISLWVPWNLDQCWKQKQQIGMFHVCWTLFPDIVGLHVNPC